MRRGAEATARVALDPGSDGAPIRIRRLAEDGAPRGEVEVLPGPGAVADLERELAPRWVLARPRAYRRLLDAGVPLARAHDVELTEGLLVGADGRFGEPHGLAAAVARLAGRRPDPDPGPAEDGPPGLFEDRPRTDELADVVAVHAAQQRRLVTGPSGLRLLVAAESTGALVAEEMRRVGLPWRAEVHDRLLTDVLGPRPVLGGRPPRLAALAREVSEAFGGRALNPDSPAEVLRAFARAGYELSSTRAGEVRRVDHPAVAPLLAYKELARLHAAHGWSWLRTWVREDRFHPEYVVGGVVSGRWATRGGGALQIPRAVRAAVRADPGWRLVVADAAQLEPRVLAAMAGEPALAPSADDLYSTLAAAEFGGDRPRAKLGLLGAMYGQTSGGAAPALATLRRRFPSAMALLEDAARAGQEGRLVRSHLGRTCPPARPGDEADGPARARGRFTRNFVVQATAAEWALVLPAELRHALRREQSPAQLVFFQHDEVLLHVPAEAAGDVADAVHAAAATAGLACSATPRSGSRCRPGWCRATRRRTPFRPRPDVLATTTRNPSGAAGPDAGVGRHARRRRRGWPSSRCRAPSDLGSDPVATVLVLGGTTEGRAVAAALDGRPGLRVVSSLAGRVGNPALPAGEVRIGGFGGADGLARWLRAERADLVVDATHPFAAGMTANAATACAAAGVELVVLRRPGWTAGPGDRWHRVASTASAAALAPTLGRRVFLTTGRGDLAAFADVDARFLIRSVDPPGPPLPREHRVLLDRGPFTLDGELELMREFGAQVLVTKDSGGAATGAKLAAARMLDVPVVMIDRPPLPDGVVPAGSVDQVLARLPALP